MKLLFFTLIALLLVGLVVLIFRQFNQGGKKTSNFLSQNKIASFIGLILIAFSLSSYLYLGSINHLKFGKTNEEKLYIEFSKALKSLSKEINKNPKNTFSWYLLAQGNLKLGNLELAKKYIEQAKKLDLADNKIDFGEILLTYAKVLATEKTNFKDKKSLDLLNQAVNQLQIEKNNPTRLNDIQKAQIKSQLIEAKWLLGLAYFSNKKIEKAVSLWKKMLSSNIDEKQKQILNEAINQANIYQKNSFKLEISLDIKPSLLQKIETNAVLFLVLKEKNLKDLNSNSNSSSSPLNSAALNMPIAAKKIKNLTFPNKFTLTQDNLLANRNGQIIERNKKFSLQAFISQKSIAKISPHDLVSKIILLDKLDNSIQLTIQKVVQ